VGGPGEDEDDIDDDDDDDGADDHNDDDEGVDDDDAIAAPWTAGDLVFLQNGMLEPFLAERGLAHCTQALIYFAVAKKVRCTLYHDPIHTQPPPPGSRFPWFMTPRCESITITKPASSGLCV
jgi:hypothetical protein